MQIQAFMAKAMTLLGYGICGILLGQYADTVLDYHYVRMHSYLF